jgi:hypothetical protein
LLKFLKQIVLGMLQADELKDGISAAMETAPHILVSFHCVGCGHHCSCATVKAIRRLYLPSLQTGTI